VNPLCTSQCRRTRLCQCYIRCTREAWTRNHRSTWRPSVKISASHWSPRKDCWQSITCRCGPLRETLRNPMVFITREWRMWVIYFRHSGLLSIPRRKLKRAFLPDISDNRVGTSEKIDRHERSLSSQCRNLAREHFQIEENVTLTSSINFRG
jgi:hypothetical protein